MNPEEFWKCWPRTFGLKSSGKGKSLPHVPQNMIKDSITRDGLHELIAEEDDDSSALPLVVRIHSADSP